MNVRTLQAIGTTCLNQYERFDTLLFTMVYPQKPMVKSRTLDLIHFDQVTVFILVISFKMLSYSQCVFLSLYVSFSVSLSLWIWYISIRLIIILFLFFHYVENTLSIQFETMRFDLIYFHSIWFNIFLSSLIQFHQI